MTPIIQNLAPSHMAHCTGNFFSFSKHPLQVKFRSSVQILWKLLVCKESTPSILRWFNPLDIRNMTNAT